MVSDVLSVNFENPATDTLGYEHIVGKLYCGREKVDLHFKQKDRAFRKQEAMQAEFEYKEIEKIEFRGGWLKPKILIVDTSSPEKLKDFPGADVGRIVLTISKDSIPDAKKVAAMIEYKQSEAFLIESEDRLKEERSNRSDLESDL